MRERWGFQDLECDRHGVSRFGPLSGVFRKQAHHQVREFRRHVRFSWRAEWVVVNDGPHDLQRLAAGERGLPVESR